MTWKSHLKMFFGLIGVVVLVAALTVVFNQRRTQVVSNSASINAEQYPVGFDYGGTVIERYVAENDHVEAGQELFAIQSPSLKSDLVNGLLKAETLAYTVSDDGIVTLTAAVAGTVTDLTTEKGSFVQAGQRLATLDRQGSLYVDADFVLTPREYSRIEQGASVDILLPNQERVRGTVGSIDVQTLDGQAETTVHVSSPDLADGTHNGLVNRGTPVSAVLLLRDDGPLAGVRDGLFDFMRRIGL